MKNPAPEAFLLVGAFPKRVATAEKSPPLPVQAHPLCLIQPFPPPGSASLTHVLFYSVPPPPKQPFSTVGTHTFTHIHFL